jgi:hypothetical protein
MKNSSDIPAKIQIRNLLIVIGSGVIFAMALAAFMLGAYSPSGRYSAQNVLLAPETAKIMKYEGLVFDRVEYSIWDAKSKVWTKQEVSLPLYQEFYALVKSDESIQELPVEVKQLFDRNPATLTLYVRSDVKQSRGQGHSFQVLQFANGGDYYRVELRTGGANEEQQWAYFHHVGLADRFLTLVHRGN